MRNLVRNLKPILSKGILYRNLMKLSSLKPTIALSPNSKTLTLATKLKSCMSTHAVHHKNVLKSTYEGPGFYVEQLFTGCLAIYSYYIQSGNECFLVDPLLDTQHYYELIETRGKQLTGIFTTHYHADYVSGQYEISQKYKCKIFMGPKSTPSDSIVALKDKEIIEIGKISLQVWHTPGHTQQSSCLLLLDQQGNRNALFTGDTIFLNQVGRPDLAVKTNLSAEDLAGMLFESVKKLKVLNDNLRILPGHGAGSACGKSIGKGDSCSMKVQKENNYAFKINQKQKFIQAVLSQMPKPPKYFGYNANLNKFEPFFFEEATKQLYKHLTPEQVFQLSKNDDVLVIDVRGTDDLKEGIIETSLCIGFDGAFAHWVGSLLDSKDKLVLLGTEQQANQSLKRLLRIGYINILGHANFPISQWKAKGYPLANPNFVDNIVQPNTTILDVRSPDEWKKHGVVEGSRRMQLTELFNNTQSLSKSKTYVVHCQSGYRAKIAYSYLLSQGYKVMAYPYPFESIFKSGAVKKVQSNPDSYGIS